MEGLRYNHCVSISLGSVKLGPPAPLLLIAGPCVIESHEHALKMARAIGAIAARLKMPYVYKASFDKANRTSRKAFRGPGLAEGLAALKAVKDELGVPVLTDIHEPS